MTVAAVAVGLGFLWRFGAFLLAAVAWFLVATMALGLVADIEVPTSAVVLAVLCWAGSQLLTRVLLCSAPPTVLSVHDARL